MVAFLKFNKMKYKPILANQAASNHHAGLGMDVDPSKIPKCKMGIPGKKEIITSCYDFMFDIIQRTYDVVQFYKPNLAFYERFGSEGYAMLENVVADIRHIAPNVLLIGDAKRGDIDNTNNAYMEALELFDAFTISPYLGGEANKPFFFDENEQLRDKLVLVLCQTSNKGANEFQGLYTLPKDMNPWNKPEGMTSLDWLHEIQRFSLPLYLRVAKSAIEWSPNVGLVTGAPFPENLKKVREMIGEDRFLLIPGIGAQEGDLEKCLAAGMTKKGRVLINTSRMALYKSHNEDFAEACRQVFIDLNERICKFRENTFGV